MFSIVAIAVDESEIVKESTRRQNGRSSGVIVVRRFSLTSSKSLRVLLYHGQI